MKATEQYFNLGLRFFFFVQYFKKLKFKVFLNVFLSTV